MDGDGIFDPSLVGRVDMGPRTDERGEFDPSVVEKAAAITSSFVKRNGVQFSLDGKPFYVHGWNTYWLMSKIAYGGQAEVEILLSDGVALGLNVCRTWAFFEGNGGLQTQPGIFDEKMFKALDSAIATAKRLGIRLILTLVNYWNAYGGKDQYVRWSKGDNKPPGDATFYTDSKCRDYFKNYIKVLTSRVNTVTNIRYRDEPAIFGWELMNEPRCTSDLSGDTLNNWIKEMSAYFKTQNRNHLLGTGSEGFYKNPERAALANPAGWALRQGTDFIRDHQIDDIDFTSAHMYSDHWLSGNSTITDVLTWIKKWVGSHIEDSTKVIKKPFVMGEFGLKNPGGQLSMSNRALVYAEVYNWIYASSQDGHAGVGTLFWQLLTASTKGTNEDGFGVVRTDTKVTDMILSQAKRLAEIRPRPAAPTVAVSKL